MSNYLETDFCSTEEGLDFIFGYMGAVYGASFTRHWEGVEADFVRQVWAKELGRFLTYKPSLIHALEHLPPTFVPSAVAFRLSCNTGPRIPDKPNTLITKQQTQYEKAKTEMLKSEALAKLEELKRDMKAGIMSKKDEHEL
jgi:hypothetical protein